MFENITNQIVKEYAPKQVLLFGSQAKGTARKNSDIDLCVVIETDNKRKLLTDLYYKIDSDKPIDFILYTPSEWEQCVSDKSSFAYKINNEGVKIYG